MRSPSEAPPLQQRRQFMFAVAMTAAAPLAVPARALSGGEVAQGTLGTFAALGAVTDRCFTPAQAFLEATWHRRLRSFDYFDDPSSAWFDDIAPALRRTPLPLVGLTSVGALFCLERLAWDLGYRVVFRTEHQTDALDAQPAAFGVAALEAALASRFHWRDCTHAAGSHGAQTLALWVLAPLTHL